MRVKHAFAACLSGETEGAADNRDAPAERGEVGAMLSRLPQVLPVIPDWRAAKACLDWLRSSMRVKHAFAACQSGVTEGAADSRESMAPKAMRSFAKSG